MIKEINKIYNINLEKTKNVFSTIIEDEEHHRELLGIIKDLFSEKNSPIQNNTPEFKYQNPDSWNKYLHQQNP